MGLRTPFYERHLALGARLTDFGGWEMPLSYGSQLEEHHAVRRAAGIFDVSHMLVIDVLGARAGEFLARVLANDVARLKLPGKALYSCMLNEAGGVIDDLIVYFRGASAYRLVVNAGTANSDLAWLEGEARPFAVELAPRRELAILAVQGPNARAAVARQLAPGDAAQALALPVFAGLAIANGFIARTGYTGEDGFELMLEVEPALALFDALIAAGIAPAGLGARDTLRLEAGMNLYGSDMDAATTPFETGLSWTVDLTTDRAFIGRRALELQKVRGVPRRQVALVLEGKGVIRAHQQVLAAGRAVGELSSGTFAPTLGRSIGLARIASDAQEPYSADLRGRTVALRVVRPPFVRHGRSLIDP
jgi:aminomethyltransferase